MTGIKKKIFFLLGLFIFSYCLCVSMSTELNLPGESWWFHSESPPDAPSERLTV